MAQSNAPFRSDIVGSFLRPQSLHEARAGFAAGDISYEALTEIEDACIRDLVAKQTAHGMKVITDGEFRRSYWHLDFMWGLHGIERTCAEHGYMFKGEETRADTAVVTGPLSGENHPFVEHFRFIKALEHEGQVARQTIPAPVQTYAEVTLSRAEGQEQSLKAAYPNHEDLIRNIVAAYQRVLSDLYAAGCRNVQFDDCTWGMYCDSDFTRQLSITQEQFAEIARMGVDINNRTLEGKPDDLVVTSHVCRGNYHSTWAFEGSYEPIAPYLFADENVHALYLEFDTPRAGGFEPLRFCSDDKYVVLGLITTKQAKLEDPEIIKTRIHEAARYIPLECLCLSPQCGFASTEEGNTITEEDQWAKISLVQKIAAEVWGA